MLFASPMVRKFDLNFFSPVQKKLGYIHVYKFINSVKDGPMLSATENKLTIVQDYHVCNIHMYRSFRAQL